jgi:hypothetical protein
VPPLLRVRGAARRVAVYSLRVPLSQARPRPSPAAPESLKGQIKSVSSDSLVLVTKDRARKRTEWTLVLDKDTPIKRTRKAARVQNLAEKDEVQVDCKKVKGKLHVTSLTVLKAGEGAEEEPGWSLTRRKETTANACGRHLASPAPRRARLARPCPEGSTNVDWAQAFRSIADGRSDRQHAPVIHCGRGRKR